MVILIGVCRNEKVFLLKPGKNTTSPLIFYRTNALRQILQKHNILTYYVRSKCNVSTVYARENEVLHNACKNSHLTNVLKIFYDSNATQNIIAVVEEISLSHYLVIRCKCAFAQPPKVYFLQEDSF